MPLLQQIANTLYDGTYTVTGGTIGSLNVGAEVNAIRPIATFGYVNIVWSASFQITNTFNAPGWFNSELSKGLFQLGWYEIMYGLTVISRHAIDDINVATPKVTGVSAPAVTVRPGATFVKGNGATITSVNIASDRPYRGDSLRYYIPPGCQGTLFLAVNTGFVDNTPETNKYIIHP